MNDENAPSSENDAEPVELPAIEFQSPGRFTVHNPQTAPPEGERWEPAPFVLGSHEPMERFSQPAEARTHVMALLQQAQRSLCLYSSDLEPWLYHHSSVQETCTRFLLAHPKSHLRILVRDSTRAVKEGHRLLQLARRLPSSVQIRKLHPNYPNEEITFLLVDGIGLLLRPELDQYAGYALYHDPARARLRQTQFEQAWDTSITDPDLRSFLL
ncbi:MAG: histone acetyltransferase HPA2 [Pseudomonas sp.]